MSKPQKSAERSKRGQESLERGDIGERIFDLALHKLGLTARLDRPDRGCDFNVEVTTTADAGPYRFLAQVKTSNYVNSPKDGSWRAALKKGRLRKYRNHQLPVFVFGVDVATETIRWMNARDPLVRSETSVPLPRENTLTRETLRSFLDEVESVKHSLEVSRVAPHEPLLLRKGILEALDRRFEVDVSASTAGGESVRIRWADRSAHIGMRIEFSTPEDGEKFSDHLRFGVPASVNVISLTFSDSQLFEAFNNVFNRIELEGMAVERRMCIGILGHHGGEIDWRLDENAHSYRGSEGTEWTSRVEGCPLTVTLRLTAEAIHFNVRLDSGVWLGSDVRELPYVDIVSKLLSDMKSSYGLAIGFYDKGIKHHLATIQTSDNREFVARWASFFRCTQALAAVCRRFDASITWRSFEEVLDDEPQSWLQVERLVEGEPARMTLGSLPFACPEDSDLDVAFRSGKGTSAIQHMTRTITAWGEPVVDLPLAVGVVGYAVRRHDPDNVEIYDAGGARAFAIALLEELSDEEIQRRIYAIPGLRAP